MKMLTVAPFLFSLIALPACAAEKDASADVVPITKSEPSNVVDPTIKAAIFAKLGKARPDLTFSDVRLSSISGLYEVEFNDGNVVYATAKGDFFIAGEIYEVTDRGIFNLSEKKRNVERAAVLAGLNTKDFITFAPKGVSKSQIYVFTDVDCGYCRKLHQEVDRLNELGVTVNYLAFPRAGLESKNFDRMASAWCSADPNKAITALKNGSNIPEQLCADNPVKEQYFLGSRLGVTGTPAIMLEDGTLIPGYQPADQLAAIINAK